MMTQPWVQHLGWTLIQFLWQGTLISVAFAIVRGLLGRSVTPHTRYILACITLCLMAAAPVLTYFVMPQLPPAPTIAWPLPSVDAWQPIMPWLVAMWLSGVIVFSIRLIGAWRVALRLQSVGTHEAPLEWDDALQRLIHKIGVSRPVRLLISTLVEVPTLVGWLRPVILVPVSALTGLPPEHVTALLAHELAHVRRLDYLVNMLQSIAEAVLFYHPAVWWVSGEIRTERELCCDDLAVAASGDALTYVQALAEFESYRPAHRTALSANGGSLLNRMRRLIGQTPVSHALPGPGAAGAMSLLLLLGIAAVAADQGALPPVPPPPPPVAVVEAPAPELVAQNTRPILSTLLFSPYGPAPEPQAPPTAQKQTTHVEGRVVSTTGEPVPRATLQLVGTGEPLTQTSDEAGKFAFDDVPPGRYSLQASRTGFITGAYGAPAPGAPAPQITLEAGTSLQGIAIKLVPQGVIAGQVTNQDREPMARAAVRLYRTAYVRGRKHLALATSAFTDDQGNYRIPNLTPGRYYLGVQPVAQSASPGLVAPPVSGLSPAQQYLAGYMAGASASALPKPNKDGLADIVTFYPNGTDIASASPLELTAGARLERTDIRIRRERVYSLKGRIAGPVEENSAMVEVTRPEGGIVTQRVAVLVRQALFEIDNLPPGTYVVEGRTVLEGEGLPVSLARTEITIGSSNVEGVSLTPTPRIAIYGTIESEGFGTNVPPRIRIVSDDAAAIGFVAQVEGSGTTFRLPPVRPGRYLLEVSSWDGVYVKSVRYNGLDVTRTPLEPTAGGGRLEIVLSAKSATLTGTLDPEPITGVTVAVWPKQLNLASPTLGMKFATTDQYGRFQISGLPPGDYYVAGWEGEPLNSGVIQIPELLAHFASKVGNVSAGEATQVTAEAKLIPATEIAAELAKLR